MKNRRRIIITVEIITLKNIIKIVTVCSRVPLHARHHFFMFIIFISSSILLSLYRFFFYVVVCYMTERVLCFFTRVHCEYCGLNRVKMN